MNDVDVPNGPTTYTLTNPAVLVSPVSTSSETNESKFGPWLVRRAQVVDNREIKLHKLANDVQDWCLNWLLSYVAETILIEREFSYPLTKIQGCREMPRGQHKGAGYVSEHLRLLSRPDATREFKESRTRLGGPGPVRHLLRPSSARIRQPKAAQKRAPKLATMTSFTGSCAADAANA